MAAASKQRAVPSRPPAPGSRCGGMARDATLPGRRRSRRARRNPQRASRPVCGAIDRGHHHRGCRSRTARAGTARSNRFRVWASAVSRAPRQISNRGQPQTVVEATQQPAPPRPAPNSRIPARDVGAAVIFGQAEHECARRTPPPKHDPEHHPEHDNRGPRRSGSTGTRTPTRPPRGGLATTTHTAANHQRREQESGWWSGWAAVAKADRPQPPGDRMQLPGQPSVASGHVSPSAAGPSVSNGLSRDALGRDGLGLDGLGRVRRRRPAGPAPGGGRAD